MPNHSPLVRVAALCSFALPTLAQTWQPLPLSMFPSARNSSAAAFDVYRGVTTLFGGYGGGPLGGTWEFGPAGWIQRATFVQPSPRWGHGMAFDSRRGVVVLFGGFDGSQMLDETWEWNGLGWAQRTLSTRPSPRGYFGMTFDAGRGVSVLFGGYAASPSEVLSGTWEYDGVAWAQRGVVPGTGPSARLATAMVWDEQRRECLLFGGSDGSQVFDDLYAWNGLYWIRRLGPGPSPRQAAAFAFDGNCGRAVLHGGADLTFATNFSDAWTWDGLQWTQLTGAQPSARHGAVAVHDAQRGRFLLVGGRDTAGFRSDTWELGSTCQRRMTTLDTPVVGQIARFRYDYPADSAATHFCWTLFTPNTPVAFPLQILGLPSVGVCRVDLAQPLMMPVVPLDASGWLTMPVAIPPNPAVAGVPFDVQSVDLDLATMTLRWAEDDEEVAVQATSAGLPAVAFTATPTTGLAPLTVTFANTTTGATSYLWDFGDGTTSTLSQPPALTFPGGNRTIGLTAIGPGGAVSAQQQITVLAANFTAAPTIGPAPLTVQFTDTSTLAATGWQWDFDNDGVVDSTQQNPSWTYTGNGLYSVRLTVANGLGSTSLTRPQLVQVGPLGTFVQMVAIPSGTFAMGTSEPLYTAPYAATLGEQGVHQVTISRPFWIGRYEVTQAEYLAVMGVNPSANTGSLQNPVERVTAQDAEVFCAALSVIEQAAGRLPAGYEFRLPTEAEWEYCCRAGTTTEFAYGPALLCSQAAINASGLPSSYCNLQQTVPVGSYAPNPWGLYDVHGNVAEWCVDKSQLYSATPVTDPVVLTGTYQVVRGGHFQVGSHQCRSTSRGAFIPTLWSANRGFRVVCGPILP